MLRALLITAVLLCGCNVRAQDTAATSPSDTGDEAITHLLRETIEEHKLPGGMVAAIQLHGEVIALGAAGVRKHGDEQPFTIDDKIHLGSCTKAMTATVAAMLVEEGKLTWDTTLAEAFPEVEIHEDFRAVTLKQLLSHRAGLPPNSTSIRHPQDMLGSLVGAPTPDRDIRARVTATELAKKPSQQPGEEHVYSNLGYVIAGHILEETTATPWQELMRTRLFEPLGMTSAGFGPPSIDGAVDQPWGHIEAPLIDYLALQHDNPSAMGPAGTVHCTISDWAKFARLHLKHPIDEGELLLKPESIDELHQVVGEGNYALGWLVVERDWAKGTAFTHGGSNTMWKANIWLAPEIDAAFFVCSNYGSAGEATDKMVGKLILELARRKPDMISVK